MKEEWIRKKKETKERNIIDWKEIKKDGKKKIGWNET